MQRLEHELVGIPGAAVDTGDTRQPGVIDARRRQVVCEQRQQWELGVGEFVEIAGYGPCAKCFGRGRQRQQRRLQQRGRAEDDKRAITFPAPAFDPTGYPAPEFIPANRAALAYNTVCYNAN